MRKQKVLGTSTFFYDTELKKLHELGYAGTHNQFRIVCQCTSMADANRKCEAAGLSNKTFQSTYTGETWNTIELAAADRSDLGIAVCLGGTFGDEYVALEKDRVQ